MGADKKLGAGAGAGGALVTGVSRVAVVVVVVSCCCMESKLNRLVGWVCDYGYRVEKVSCLGYWILGSWQEQTTLKRTDREEAASAACVAASAAWSCSS